MLIANERIRKIKQAKILTPVAQYLLLYHLQVGSLEGLAARDMEDKMPYSYASITLGRFSSILLKNAFSATNCCLKNISRHAASMPLHITLGSIRIRKG